MSGAEAEVVVLHGLVVGPDQWLVLSSRVPVEADDAAKIFSRIPAALKGRVLLVDQMDVASVSAEASA